MKKLTANPKGKPRGQGGNREWKWEMKKSGGRMGKGENEEFRIQETEWRMKTQIKKGLKVKNILDSRSYAERKCEVILTYYQEMSVTFLNFYQFCQGETLLLFLVLKYPSVLYPK